MTCSLQGARSVYSPSCLQFLLYGSCFVRVHSISQSINQSNHAVPACTSIVVYVSACGNWSGLWLWQPFDRRNLHHLTLHLLTYHLYSCCLGICHRRGIRWEEYTLPCQPIQERVHNNEHLMLKSFTLTQIISAMFLVPCTFTERIQAICSKSKMVPKESVARCKMSRIKSKLMWWTILQA